MKHFTHIDGLRAIAVLAVVFNHLGVHWLPGGFVGVDIFFVISGFVITYGIKDRLVKGEFSLLDFYDRRVRRIFPAMLIIVGLSLVYGYFALPSGDYASLGNSAFSSALFFANVYFMHNTGYFDASAHAMPLLHLWSLAVEEQFYIAWPIVAWLLWKMTEFKGIVFASILGILLSTSLLACLFVTLHEPKAAFFLPYYRAWEFLLGTALAVGYSRLNLTGFLSAMLGVIGFFCMTYALLFITEDDAFPGIYALLPVIGALLLIASGLYTNWWGVRFLSSAIPRFFGHISYSLYLWHWPLIVFFIFYKGGGELTRYEQGCIFIASVVLATLTMYLIENPLRYMKMSALRRVSIGIVAAGLVALSGHIINAQEGFPHRLSANVRGLSSLKVMWDWPCSQTRAIEGLAGNEWCVLGADWDKASRKGVLWGDSHAEHFAPEIHEVAKQQNLSLLLWRACPAYVSYDIKLFRPKMPEYYLKCANSRKRLEEWIAEKKLIQTMVLAGAWRDQPEAIYKSDSDIRSRAYGLKLMKDGFVDLFKVLPATIDHIVLLGDVPRFSNDPIPCARRRIDASLIQQSCDLDILNSAEVIRRHADTDAVLKAAALTDKRVIFIPSAARMCTDKNCLTYVKNEFLYRDSHHLRRNFSFVARTALITKLGLTEALAIQPVKTE
jgi:peptidoglycan/LPS O-acetylase OafA/YrhL